VTNVDAEDRTTTPRLGTDKDDRKLPALFVSPPPGGDALKVQVPLPRVSFSS
jgi:hypothetical protein